MKSTAHAKGDISAKPAHFLPTYEAYLSPLREEEFVLLELGIWRGDSLRMWRDAFPEATIIGVDLSPPETDLGPRVNLVSGDQSDPDLLGRLRETYAPQGFRVVIDDASHIGVTTARSLEAVYPGIPPV
ncbi:MAG: hypothetical protein U0R52_10155 [Solirubrobacterales bacterium]